MLTQWHTLILDPLQPGVFEALSWLPTKPTYVIGRIDIAAITTDIPDDDRIGKVKAITDKIIAHMGPSSDGKPTPFNGVLIANWDCTITPGICNEIIGFLAGLNLNVYNEITAPRFMDKLNSALKIESLSGVVFINGSIMPNGERRDFFNLLSMKTALETATGQSCLREFAVLMCELIEDEYTPTTAVIKRSFTWCNYYGAIAWIGRRAALKDPAQNVCVQQPDGAFEFLKRERVIDVHEIWRFNSKVSLPHPNSNIDYARTRSRCIGVPRSRTLCPRNFGCLQVV